jgi:hypothetical protein
VVAEALTQPFDGEHRVLWVASHDQMRNEVMT